MGVEPFAAGFRFPSRQNIPIYLQHSLSPLLPTFPALEDSMIGSDGFRGSDVITFQHRNVRPAALIETFARFQAGFFWLLVP